MNIEKFERQNPNLTIIDCGIGYIGYTESGNLVLQDLMENLEALIKKTTPKAVNELLEKALKND